MALMDPLSATLMTAELLGNPMHVGIALVLSPPPDAGPGYVDEQYDQAVGGDVEIDPQLLRRPRRGLGTGGLWSWEVADLDLTAHVQRRHLATGSGRDELWRVVAELHQRPLDRDRPLWEACLIDGLEDGRFVLYLKVHHALVDGISGLRLVEASMSTDPEQRDMVPFFGVRDSPERNGGGGRLGLPNPLRALGAATGIAQGEVDALVEGLKADTTVLPFRAPRTRLNGALGPERSFAGGAWMRDRLTAVQEAARRRTDHPVTSNDVVTAMVAGALRRWFAEHDELPRQSLVAICPVSVRSRGEEAPPGNAFGTAVVRLGTDVADPVARLETVHRSMDLAKKRVARMGSVPSLLATAPSILPTVVLPMLPLDPKLPPGYNLPISNVPGPREALFWNGARLDEMYPVSVVYDGMGLNATICSYADRLCFGYVGGREAVPDPERLVPHTEQALVELEEGLEVGR